MSEMENKKEYEMSYFLSADTPEDKFGNVKGGLNSLILESGGENIALETPKRRQLSYKINKRGDGYFGVVYFNIVTEGLLKLKKSLALDKKILRYMILNKPLKPKPAEAPKLPMEISEPTQSFDQKFENILNR